VSPAFSTQTSSSKTASVGTDGISNQKSDPNLYQPTLKEQPSDWPRYNNKARMGSDEAVDNIDSAEFKEYNILIESMLRKIDSCKAKLEDSRHLRIKNGVLNIHSGEIVRFQLEHGPSIHIDPLLFACVSYLEIVILTLTDVDSEQKTEKSIPKRTPAVYSSSDTSEEYMLPVDIACCEGGYRAQISCTPHLFKIQRANCNRRTLTLSN
jgi:hypothetical protein